MKIWKFLLVSTLLPMLWGCGTVTSSAPVGDQPVNLVAEQWDGTWMGSEGVITLKVIDAKQGRIHAAWIEESGGKLKMESWQVQIRSSGDWSFANVKDEEETEDQYLFARVNKDDGQILFWLPDRDALAAAVKAGRFPGEISDSSVRLSTLDASHLKTMMAESGLFVWDEPLVLLRLRD